MGEGWYDSRKSNVVAGFYEVEVESAEDGVFQTSGKRFMRCWFRVVGGELDGEGFEERVPEFKVIAFAKALGITPSQEVPFFTTEMLGKRFSVEVEMNTFNGQTTPRVKPGGIRWTNPPAGQVAPGSAPTASAPGDPKKTGDTPF